MWIGYHLYGRQTVDWDWVIVRWRHSSLSPAIVSSSWRRQLRAAWAGRGSSCKRLEMRGGTGGKESAFCSLLFSRRCTTAGVMRKTASVANHAKYWGRPMDPSPRRQTPPPTKPPATTAPSHMLYFRTGLNACWIIVVNKYFPRKIFFRFNNAIEDLVVRADCRMGILS